jgi:molecular chaperone DnaK
MLADFGDRLTDEIKQRINTALRETRESLEKRNVEQATQRAEALGKILKEAGVSVYAQTPGAEKVYRETRAPGMGGDTDQSHANGSQRVVDAEFKETGKD